MTDGIVEWIMAGGILTITGFSIATYCYVGKAKEETEKKVNRNYDRLDEVKDNMDDSYTRKDLCIMQHRQVSSDLSEIKERTECIPAIKLGMDLLLKKNGIKKDG